tara:strand:+ start:633 stop:1013 length:381 start_codon:yes stop_codon:yes gene_type:complete
MAYASSVTRTKVADSNVDYVYDITETDSTSGGNEVSIDLTTSTGRILKIQVDITSGSGKVKCQIGVSSSPTGNDVIALTRQKTDIDEQPDPILFFASGKKLYINNQASADGLNISTRIFIRETWGL